MHGDQENIGIVEPYWKSVLDQGYTLALPQSSQIQFSDGFVWDDIHRGKEELKEHYVNFKENYTIESVIIGGFFCWSKSSSIYNFTKRYSCGWVYFYGTVASRG